MSVTLIAKNQTVGAIVLADLGVTVPGSGQLTLTTNLRSDEVLGSPDLQTQVIAGNLILNDGTEDIVLADSVAWFTGNFRNIPDIGAVVGGTLFSSVPASTTSATFVDAFAGGSILVPADGDYFLIFEGTFNSGGNNRQTAIAVGVNSTTVAQATSERIWQTPNDPTTGVTTLFKIALTAGQTVHGLYRKAAGAGSVTAITRRITIFRLNT
jgi:hypothetical protein